MAFRINNEANTKGICSHRASLMVNAWSNWVVFVVNAGIGLLLTPYIIAHINKDGYGIWMLVCLFVGYFGLLRLGVGAGILRYVALYDGHKDLEKVSGIFSTAMGIYVVVALVTLGVLFLGAGLITEFFHGDAEFRVLVRLIGIAAAIGCITAVINGTILAREEYVPANAVIMTTSIIRAIAVAGLLYLGYGLVEMGYVTVAIALISLLLHIGVFLKICSDIKFSLKMIRFSHFQCLISLGFMATLMNVGFMLRYQSDRIIIGKFINMEALGIYGVAAALMLYFRNGVAAMTRVLAPRFAYLDGKGNSNETITLFLNSTKGAAILASGIALTLLLTGPSFIRLWVGTGFEKAHAVLLILTVAYMVDLSQTASVSLLGGFGKQSVLAAFAIGEGLAGVVLSLILVQKYGMIGVAAGIAAPMILIQALVRPIYVCHFVQIGMLRYYKSCLLKPWLLVGLLFFVIRSMHLEEYLTTWLWFILCAVMLGLLYFFTSYVLILTPKERCSITKRVVGVFPFKGIITYRSES